MLVLIPHILTSFTLMLLEIMQKILLYP